MGDLTFRNIKNGNWYVIPDRYYDEPARIIKTIYHGNCYIRAIATNFDQDIVKVPCDERIFSLPPDVEGMDDQEDFDEDIVFLEKVKQNKEFNYISYYPNVDLNLTDDEKLELFTELNIIENKLKTGGKRKKKRKTKRKRKINKRKKSKTKNYMH